MTDVIRYVLILLDLVALLAIGLMAFGGPRK